MSPSLILLLVASYFVVLLLISFLTGRSSSNSDFFLAGRNAPWYIVAFGMVGTSLSGITFISIPGKVGITDAAGNYVDQFSYMQMVLGYLAGYVFIAFALLPLYYRLGLTSIYTYLDQRFGTAAWKTGAFFFLLSRTVGASIRLLLVATVLQTFVFDAWGVPFVATVALSIVLIWVYTQRGGMKTIIYTDTLQTLFMLAALGLSIYLILQSDTSSGGLLASLDASPFSQWFFFDDFSSNNYHFWKQFIGGFFICIGMTGMDQDMMQKNLACRNIREAQKNMLSFAAILFVVNFFFLALGALLFQYAAREGIDIPMNADGKLRTDLLFPTIALTGSLGSALALFFLLGLTAAAYSSADSALTSLTTSVSVDFLSVEKREERAQVRLRKVVHLAVSALLLVVILLLHYNLDLSAIDQLIVLAGYTYGPLIGLFLFGLSTAKRPHAAYLVFTAVLAPVATYLLTRYSAELFGGFSFGALHIALNAGLTYAALLLGPSASKSPLADSK